MKYADVVSTGIASVTMAVCTAATVARTDDLWAWAAALMLTPLAGGAIKLVVHNILTGDVDADDDDVEVVDLDE